MTKRSPARVEPKRGAGAPVLKRNVADLRALAHPIRLRMLELFAERPRTTKQVAELLGQPPTRLYHHVAALERAGLLKLTETRPNRGAVEKWYEAVTRLMQASEGKATRRRSTPQARRAVVATVLDQAKQEVLSASFAPKEPPLIARLVVVAPTEKMAEVRTRLFETIQTIRTEFDCGRDGDSADDASCSRWAITLAFAPVWPKPRARGQSSRTRATS